MLLPPSEGDSIYNAIGWMNYCDLVHAFLVREIPSTGERMYAL